MRNPNMRGASDALQDAVTKYCESSPPEFFALQLKSFCYGIKDSEGTAITLRYYLRCPFRKPSYLMQAMQRLSKALPKAKPALLRYFTPLGSYFL